LSGCVTLELTSTCCVWREAYGWAAPWSEVGSVTGSSLYADATVRVDGSHWCGDVHHVLLAMWIGDHDPRYDIVCTI
jgi:hypothetical protein